MPQSLWDMFQPTTAAGDPAGFGDAVTSRSNSLIGLGLGMLAPSNPLRGQSSWGQALEGFQSGAQLDARTAAALAARRQHAADRAQSMAQHARDRRQAQSNFERTFAAGQQSPFSKVAADLGLQPGTPEYVEAARQYHQPKTEGDWQITKLPHPTIPGDEVTVERNKRTGRTRLPEYPATTDPFTAGIGQPVNGGGAAPQAAPSGAIPSSPSQAAPAGYRWGAVNPETGRRELVPIEGGPASKLPEGAASKLAMLEAAKPGLEEAKKYFLDPRPLHLREGGDQAGGALYSMGKQAIGQHTGSFEIGRQRRNVRYGIEAALRAATGAAAPEQEVDRYTDMYAPSIYDDYKTRKQKIDALDRFITTYGEVATRGHGPSKSAGSPAAPSSGGVRRYNPETGKIE